MADVAPSFLNYGGIASQENTMANTAVQGAQAGLVGEQAKQAAMQTEVQRASMPLILGAINDATRDQSGANSGNPDAVPGAAASRAASADKSGVNSDWYQADDIENSLRTKNYVSPYTPQELKMLQTSKTLSIADPARGKAMFDMMEANRKARMETQTAGNQLQMGNLYDGMDAITSLDPKAPPGTAANLMRAIAPQTMATIEKLSQADGVDLDTEVRRYAGHVAGVAHMYAGRPTEMQNGQLIDKTSGKQVTGIDQIFTGLTPEQRQKEFDYWNETAKWTTPDGVEHTDARWKMPVEYGGHGGKLTPEQSVLAADQAARQRPGAPAPAPLDTGAAAKEASNTGLAPPMHGGTAAKRVAAKQAAAGAAATAQTGSNIAAGTASPTGADTGGLPGVNPAALPKTVSPTAAQGPGTPGIAGTKALEGVGTRQNQEIESTKTASVDAQTMHSQIVQAKAEIAKINPRTVGPGSTLYNGMLKAYTAAAGTAPDALIDETVLDKFLNQIGASNVRNLLAGQRITNQEMMTFLTRGSPSTAMPLGGITHLLNYLDADNEYTLRYNRTKMMGLKSGADPDLIDQELSNRLPRAKFVQARTGSPDALKGETPAPKLKWSDEQVRAYAAANKIPEAEARRFLAEQK